MAYSVLARARKLEHPNVRAVYATDAVPIAEKGWTKRNCTWSRSRP
jgi:hypothetical protein